MGQGQNPLRYLSRYVFRVAISNNRIKSIENNVIKFSYNGHEADLVLAQNLLTKNYEKFVIILGVFHIKKDREKKKWKIMALDAMD